MLKDFIFGMPSCSKRTRLYPDFYEKRLVISQ